jgi:hypothetical protein
MREKFNQQIKSCGTWNVPAAETKSIRLSADPDAAVMAGALVPCPPERPKRIFIPDLTLVRSGGQKTRHRDPSPPTGGSGQAPMAPNYCSASLAIRRAVSTNWEQKNELATLRNLLNFSLYCIIHNSICTLPSFTYF